MSLEGVTTEQVQYILLIFYFVGVCSVYFQFVGVTTHSVHVVYTRYSTLSSFCLFSVCGRYSTFSSLGLEVMVEFYAINGFPTKTERKIICEFVGETDKRVQVI